MTRARTPRPHEVDEARRDKRLLRAFREQGQDPAWRTRGVCQTVDPELFFPAPSESAEAAVALCRTCPVQGSCLAWALDAGDLYGVWGATTARERRAMAVVWHSGELAEAGRMSVSAGRPAPVDSVPVGHRLPPALPARPVLNRPVLDRLELLRLVDAR
jgi:hypothetical protein